MRVRVLFFGLLRDLVGRSEDSLELPDGSSLETVFRHYASHFPRLEEMENSLVLARNQEFADRAESLVDGDEIALMPPVSGGSSLDSLEQDESPAGNLYALTSQAIDVRELSRRLLRGADGAVITFEGVVRDNNQKRRTRYLDYDCYRPLALKAMREIGEDIVANFGIDRIGMVHRLGRLRIGEASVVIVVTSAHRRPAYEASLEAINRLKKRVPIWKKEYFEDGEVWVEGAWDDSLLRSAGTPR